MCRRIITHNMHHDVAVPMILDPVIVDAIPCANPLRTQFHRCEVAPNPPFTWMLNTPVENCPYHSCCVPEVEEEFCHKLTADVDEDDEDAIEASEPEQCEDFILEHHHERLPYFGNEYVNPEAVPATWRFLGRIRGRNPDWFLGFAHDGKFRANWEEKCFAECEKLYILKNDLDLLYAAVQDLMDRALWDMAQTARAQYLRAGEKLHEQMKLVFDLFEWAVEPCNLCER
ncbi:hypothetical protein F5Y14DRAFT_465692 [Nemania sp. NC0429]|nr:hypothetical protein F5Y14DRAFT_465692 [Nemania sp. NC0429]